MINTTSTLLTGRDFSEALQYLKEGAVCYRQGWNGIKRGVNMYVMLVDKHDSYAPHFILYNSELQETNLWTPRGSDILAEDWEIQPNYPSALTASGTAVDYGLDGGKMPEPSQQGDE